MFFPILFVDTINGTHIVHRLRVAIRLLLQAIVSHNTGILWQQETSEDFFFLDWSTGDAHKGWHLVTDHGENLLAENVGWSRSELGVADGRVPVEQATEVNEMNYFPNGTLPIHRVIPALF